MNTFNWERSQLPGNTRQAVLLVSMLLSMGFHPDVLYIIEEVFSSEQLLNLQFHMLSGIFQMVHNTTLSSFSHPLCHLHG